MQTVVRDRQKRLSRRPRNRHSAGWRGDAPSMDHLLTQTNPATGNAAAVDCLFGFTGRPLDTNTSLQNNLNRWYDSSVGRWISEDPTGFAAGDTNTYRYVGNSPANAVDPSGLDIIVLFGPNIQAGKGHLAVTVGHPAIMIGSDQTGWQYASFHAGDQRTTNDNVQAFWYTTVAAAQADIKETGEYTTYLYIPTTSAADARALAVIDAWQHAGPPTMLGKAIKRIFGDKYQPILGAEKVYRLASQNCATFVNDVIDAALPQQLGFPHYKGILKPTEWKPNVWWPNEVLPWAAKYPLGKGSIGPFDWKAAGLPSIPAQIVVVSPVANVKIYLNGQLQPGVVKAGQNTFLTGPLKLGTRYHCDVKLVYPSGGSISELVEPVTAGLSFKVTF